MNSNPDPSCSLAISLTTTLSSSIVILEIIYYDCIKRTLTFPLSYNDKSLVNPDRDKFKLFLDQLNNLCGKKKYFWTVKKPSLKPIS